ncbi:myrosinase 1-like [Anthonomus grandis grandis]|uniref:myrosinase 1-like n=1 Tax=Anthonomus grandis grandis TaxID=2921223 RepID=UPI0021650674|nr:myrosinase 1-like [Anthonomus grandis grandis]
MLVLILFSLLAASLADDYVINTKRFPKDFQFGTASAAYQIEGGWDADGKGENIWDRSVHLYPEKNSYATGDIACDSYHKWQEDVDLLVGMGVNSYRFSIAWSRVLPTGLVNSSNPAGIAYYKNLIAALKKNNIEPLVTMHHWDLPTYLEDLGGFTNSQIQDWFVDYARFLFENFGDDVKNWITFNEPKQTCEHGYGTGALAPNIYSPGVKDYQCAHNLIIAHGKAYRMYEKEFKAKQNGRITMVIDSNWFGPGSDSEADIEAAERDMLFTYGWFGHPINFGDYPEIMKIRIANRSALEGFASSRLPSFSDEEKQIINGTADFMCVNIYTSSLVKAIPEPDIIPNGPGRDLDVGVQEYQPDDWEPTVTSWFKVVPWGARKIVKWISDTYNHPEIMVTENGYHDNGTVIHDMDTRGRYHKLYLSNLLDAIYEDGVNLTGYMAWALTDDFEWQYGYNIQLGFYQVNFTDPDRPRTPKDSASYYRKVVTTRCLVDDDQCVD